MSGEGRHALIPIADLAPRSVCLAQAGAVSVCVVRTGSGDVHVLGNRCPHRGASLASGWVFERVVDTARDYGLSDDEWVLRCPWHGHEFDVTTGRCIADPDKSRIRVYPVEVDDGMVYTQLQSPRKPV